MDYKERHYLARISPSSGFELAFIKMLDGWILYAEEHAMQYKSSIGEDHFLGPEWKAIGESLRTLLNGSVGESLHCGLLDREIVDAAAYHGCPFED